MRAISIILLLSQIHVALSDFYYTDFNQTTGLVFNGAAQNTNCDEASEFVESDLSNDDDRNENDRQTKYGALPTTDTFTTIATVQHNSSSDDIAIHDAVFGHRREFETSVTTGCSTRLRLTPSQPSKAGSIWYESRVPVLRGFETIFSWQITDHSVECSEHVDRSFSQHLHKSCAVHGGDGFAFVIHGDPADSAALGGDGEHLGYGGISNSLAIEFVSREHFVFVYPKCKALHSLYIFFSHRIPGQMLIHSRVTMCSRIIYQFILAVHSCRIVQTNPHRWDIGGRTTSPTGRSIKPRFNIYPTSKPDTMSS